MTVKRYKTYNTELQCIDDPCGEFDLSREVVVVLAPDLERVEAELASAKAEAQISYTALEHSRERIAALEAALRRYGRHFAGCESEFDALGLAPCNCGLDAALAGTKP